MKETAERAKRPQEITFICIWFFLEAIIEAPFIFSPAAQQIGSWYPTYGGISTVLMLACIIGLWKMKKWAAYTFTGLIVLSYIVALAINMSVLNVILLLISAVFIFLVLRNVSKMS